MTARPPLYPGVRLGMRRPKAPPREYSELPEATPAERMAQLRALRRRLFGDWQRP